MRLLLDEHYPPELAELLRATGHDVVAASERDDLAGRSDERLLEAAAEAGRVLLTENARDFEPLSRRYAAESRKHAGLVLASARRWPRTRAGLPALAQAIGALLDANPDPEGLRGLTVRLPSPGD